MNRQPRVGDLVFLQHPTYHDEFDGVPAMIVGGYACRKAVNMRTMESRMVWTYEVQMLKAPDCLDDESGTLLVQPYQIRLPGQPDDHAGMVAAQKEEVASC